MTWSGFPSQEFVTSSSRQTLFFFMSTQSVGSPNQTMAELQPPNMTMTSSLSCSPNSSISDALDQTTVPSSTVDNGSSAAAIRAPSSVVHPASDPEDQTPTDSYPSLGIEQQEEEEDDDDEDKVPLDLVRLTFLLVSGNRHALDFEPTTLVHQVKEHLLSHWPDGNITITIAQNGCGKY